MKIYINKEEDTTYPVLNLLVDRYKTQNMKTTPDHIMHFAHTHELHKCHLWNSFYHRVIAKAHNAVDEENHMFPHWKKLVKFIDGKVSSHCSTQFKDV